MRHLRFARESLKSVAVIGSTQSILVFGNPISGLGRGLAIAQNVCETASATGIDARLWLQHPAAVADDWIPQGPDGVAIVIGGDGTLRSVVERLVRFAEPDRPMPRLLTIPLGTANLVATHLGSRWRPDRIARDVLHAIAVGRRRRFDIARANGRAMLAIGGVGFDAKVVHELSARRRGPITYANYVLPTVKSLTGYRFHPLTVSVDGQPLLRNTPAIAFVGNIAEYGAGFSVTPTARSDDGLLDICLLPCSSWQELLSLGLICGTGSQISSEHVIYRRGKHVEVTADEAVPVQVDGDESGFTPVTFDLLEQPLTFIVPPDHHAR